MQFCYVRQQRNRQKAKRNLMLIQHYYSTVFLKDANCWWMCGSLIHYVCH